MKKLLIILFAILMIAGQAGATAYYVSKSGNNSDGTSWVKAWTSFASINWTNCAAGDILYIDEGRYEEKLTVGASGSPTTEIGSTTYETLYNMSNAALATDGWLVIAAGASDGVLNSEVRICGSKLTGKAEGQYEGTANSGYSLTAEQTNTYECSHSTAVDAVFELSTTDLTTKGAATALTVRASIATVEANAGSYWYDSANSKLYVHKIGSGNVATSTHDFEAVIDSTASIYPVDVSTVSGVVFDGGSSRLLRLSYGDAAICNGIIKNSRLQTNFMFRNMKMLYGTTAGHFMNPLYRKGIFYNCEMGKVYSDQAFSFSPNASSTMPDIYIINNTIWDGFETHGSADITPTLTNWYVNGNTFRFEKLNSGNDYGLLKLYYVTMTNGDIQIKNNTFIDVDEWLDSESTARSYLSAIQIYPYITTNTGTITISGNSIVLDTQSTNAGGYGITVQAIGAATCNISGNTISGLSNTNQSAFTLLGNRSGTAAETINIFNNTVSGCAYGLTGAPTTPGINRLNLYKNKFSVEHAINAMAAKVINNYDIYQNYLYAAFDTNVNFIAITGAANFLFHNNFVNPTKNTALRLESLSGECNIYGNIIANNIGGSSYNIRLLGAGWTNINITNNVFYNIIRASTIGMEATITDAVTANIKNNIFHTNSLGVLDSSTNANFSSDYNYYYNNTADVSGGELGANDVADVDPKLLGVSSGAFYLQYDSPCINAGVNLGSTYNDALHPLTDYSDPDTIFTADQDNFGSGWEIGAYVYVPGGLH